MPKTVIKDKGKSNKEITIIWSDDRDDPTIKIWSSEDMLRKLDSTKELENGVRLVLPDEFIINLRLIRRPWLLADKIEMDIGGRKIYRKVGRRDFVDWLHTLSEFFIAFD